MAPKDITEKYRRAMQKFYLNKKAQLKKSAWYSQNETVGELQGRNSLRPLTPKRRDNRACTGLSIYTC